MPTLKESREAFLANMCKLSGVSERPQFQAILDDFIGWSVARPDVLSYHDKDHRQNLVSFRLTDSAQVIWTAYPKMNAGAKLSVLPGGNGRLPEELLAEIVAKRPVGGGALPEPGAQLGVGWAPEDARAFRAAPSED